MFSISWALTQNCRFWNSRDVNVFGISGSGLEMLILRLDPHFRYFPSHGSNIDFDTCDVQFRYFLGPGFEVHFKYFPGRDLNGWIWCSWGWPRRCSVSISSSQKLFLDSCAHVQGCCFWSSRASFSTFLRLLPNNVEFQALKLILGISISLVQTCEWGSCETTNILNVIVFREAWLQKHQNLDADSFVARPISLN